MSLNYKIWKKKFKDASGNEQTKYYVCKNTTSRTNTESIIDQVQEASSLTKGDVLASIYSIVDVIVREMSNGHSVKIDGLGTFNLSLTSEAMDNPNEIRNVKVKKSRITFRPDKKFKEKLDNIHFSKAKEVR